MLESTDVERREVIFRGMVQGVGFRYTARAIARNHPIVGFVRNLPDGRVQLVVEGQAETIERYLKDLRHRMADYIAEAEETVEEATGEFGAFEVRF